MTVMRSEYRTLTDQETLNIKIIKEMGGDFLEQLDGYFPECREVSLARTKIEEAVMWAVKGITK